MQKLIRKRVGRPHRGLCFLLAVAFSSSLLLVMWVCVYLYAHKEDVVLRENLLHTNFPIPVDAFTNSPAPTASHIDRLSTTATSTSNFKVTLEGKVPERVFLSEGDNIHFTVRTSSKNYEKRLPLVFLTWFQTVPPSHVSY